MKEKIDKLEKCLRLFGYKVIALHRNKIGNIEVKNIQLGKWRYLNDTEINKILKGNSSKIKQNNIKKSKKIFKK